MTKEHIVQIAVGVDDDAIINAVQRKAESEIIKSITQSVANRVFESRYYYGNADPDKDKLSEFSKEIVYSFLEKYKEEIIASTVKLLADKIARTRGGKKILEGLSSKAE